MKNFRKRRVPRKICPRCGNVSTGYKNVILYWDINACSKCWAIDGTKVPLQPYSKDLDRPPWENEHDETKY